MFEKSNIKILDISSVTHKKNQKYKEKHFWNYITIYKTERNIVTLKPHFNKELHCNIYFKIELCFHTHKSRRRIIIA